MTYAHTRPSWVMDTDEVPHDIEATQGWSENYYSCAYDPAMDIGLYVHLSRRAGSPHPWEEVVAVTLPDDQFLVSKSIASGSTDGGPTVGAISYRCQEPFVRWSKAYRGAARRVSGAELRAAPFCDGPHENLEIDLTFAAMSPPFDYGIARVEQDWANGHYEQHGRLTGTLTVAGRPVEFNGTGLRDHSWGPRDLAKVGDTSWLHGQFPASGRGFMLVHIPQPPGPSMTYAVVTDAARVEAVKLVSEVPTAKDVEDAEQGSYTLVFDTSEGEQVIEAEMLTAVRMSFVGPSEFCFGFHRGPLAHHDYVEAVTRYTWNGEVGYGFSERTVRV